ncbi:hypothetical protein BD626DRAFT_173909 [Schizophyllum amplum]|uniref:RING-type domain-containing protein n=1 Tax=Schizophyllum amplum TaxID=97359 RepID=A0A550C2G0_9AGAR|nr:hypothetical protein BD626DRAFT_173909 [Auriculariopsis ampla]
MITLLPGSTCDIGAEEFSAHRPPFSLPCGHVLCRACCDTIVEKTSPRLEPVCPFCRETFKASDPRVVRVDWAAMPKSQPTPPLNENPIRVTAMSGNPWKELNHPSDGSRGRPEARQLEDKVAKLAATKTSVEAIQSLLADLDHWLLHAKRDSSSTSLSLSAALLRAILMNHLAHSEAMRHAKTVEANLRGEVDNVKMSNSKLQEELRRTREEASSLRQEVNSLRVLHTTLSPSSIPLPESRATSAPSSAATSPATSPSTSPTPYNQPSSFFTRLTSGHMSHGHMSSASAAAHASPSGQRRPQCRTAGPTRRFPSALPRS